MTTIFCGHVVAGILFIVTQGKNLFTVLLPNQLLPDTNQSTCIMYEISKKSRNLWLHR